MCEREKAFLDGMLSLWRESTQISQVWYLIHPSSSVFGDDTSEQGAYPLKRIRYPWQNVAFLHCLCEFSVDVDLGSALYGDLLTTPVR